MFKTTMTAMHMCSDAYSAPACHTARNSAAFCSALLNDTAMLVVSFLHVILVGISGLVRIIEPCGAKP